ncbi:hypothetical protein [Pseudonocardia alni]|uniref:hypothetical protein n=1 Tax=Pseudonocardia alni TaxID=33907 RepID=UPI001AD74F93|nr:hypothetical protein [Pseudonocardia alni]MBO4239089.1 hypothetical protein [Pseudonocardia alni]
MGLESTRIRSTRWSSDTIDPRPQSRRGSMKSRQAVSSKKMRAAFSPPAWISATPMQAPAELP